MKKRVLSLFLALSMVLSMLPVSAFAVEIPNGTNIASITSVTEIKAGEEISFSLWGMVCESIPSYIATIPVGTESVTLTFTKGTYPAPYEDYYTGQLSLSCAWVSYSADDGSYSGRGGSHKPTATGDAHSIELDVAAMIEEGTWYCAYDTTSAPIYLLSFEYAEGEGGETESADPFLSIAIDGEKVDEESIEYRGIFKMGDYHKDEQQENQDTYDYVHEVPYYYVTVPCGTESVNVTYSADTNIMYYGSDAYGYATVIDAGVDLVSSATVKGRTFKNAYTLNDDGTQTVRTPVTGYAVDEDGNGKAITLEEDGEPNEAICLFSFKYDGLNHVYDNGTVTTQPTCEDEGVKTFTCSCGDSYTEAVDATGHSYADGTCGTCGATDPDYAAPGAEIPEGAPFTAITADAGDVLGIEDKGTVDYNSTYNGVPYYHVTIPAGTEAVYVTHPSSEDPFADSNNGHAYGYFADTTSWSGGGMTFEYTEVADGVTITLPLEFSATDWETWETIEGSFAADEDGNVDYAVAVERNDFSPICFFTFEYAAASGGGDGVHTHQYDEGVVTTEPTCEDDGVKTFTCSGCDENTEGHTRTEVVAATGHSWNDGEVTTQPTCEGTGVKTFTCENDETHTKTESVAAAGHDWEEGVVTTEPTCTEPGVKTFTCKTDGTHTKTETVPSVGHEWGDDKICDRDGCGAVNNEPEKDENGVYQVGTAMELLWFAEKVNSGQTALDAVLTADIDLTGKEWPGIGTSGKRFAGTFDGNSKRVTFDGAAYPLIGYMKGSNNNKRAVVKNVITDGTVTAAAAIVGYAGEPAKDGFATIQKCINYANVNGVAGIIGEARKM